MGSNQGKRPHHADRGGKVWSRDERRWNRKQMRDQAARADIEDSLASNEHPDDDDLMLCDHELDENGWCPCDDELRRPKVRRKKASKKWCRRKEGREHKMVFVRSLGFRWYPMHEYRCSECGHKSYERTRKDA